MKREIVQEFLDLPGIVGIALMDARSRPYFLGVDQALNFQQKEALAQGIRQVIETTPENFGAFEFQFSGHQVHIYKLVNHVILLTLTNHNLVYENYLEVVEKLKASLQEDPFNAIPTFRLVVGNITLSGQNYWKPKTPSSLANNLVEKATQGFSPTHLPPSTQPSAVPGTPPSAANSDSTNLNGVRPNLPSPDTAPPPAAPSTPDRKEVTPPPEEVVALPSDPSEELATLKEVLSALNHLSQFTTQFLGVPVIVNYWKSTRPDNEWLKGFQIDRSACLSLAGVSPQEHLQSLDEEQHKLIKQWVAAFIKRGAQVIRDFPKLIEQDALDARQSHLLLG